jgi:putative Mg2+ transporter-C (MgtC) family protein
MLAPEDSPTRIAAQVVSGIGFLGGGVILREGLNVKGMSTAATIWCTGAVGTLAGSGFVAHGAIGTAAVLFLHLALRPVAKAIDARMKSVVEIDTVYRVRVICPLDQEGIVRTIFMRHVNSHPHMSIQGLSIQEAETKDRVAVVAEVFSIERNDKFMNELVSRISVEPSINSVSWDRMR